MSVQLIQQYYTQVEKIIRYGGTRKETAVRKPFHDLLEQYARQRNLELIGELDYRTRQGRIVIPDGTLKDALRQDWGYWESKDEQDDLDAEIEKKFAKGYPCNNILFEDTQMIVQHVLTEDIFITVFDEPQFHRENIIAHELGEVVGTFYKGQARRQIDARIEGYTRAIKARAAQIYNHQEKQKFLKVLYENFYKAYNPKAADRLGIVYTPNEIVRFMIEAADYLCFQHFGKTLGDKGVEILDPTTGTGTFVTELIEYLPPQQLAYKYKNELHCNEVAILPYYIANLNIEYTYKQKMGRYVPFENIVFMDTLDNMGFKTEYVRQLGLFGLTDENLERIERQNRRDISVIIGNPPYNANQKNENENNKNREYPAIDKRIKETYIKASTAQKTKLYDMYTRFYRWAADRIGQDGIIAFVTNRSFLDARGYDGFRKVVAEEFSHIYVVDLGGDVRQNPKLSGPKHNVFAIQTGVALAFMVRKQEENKQPCKIWYTRRPELEEARDKLHFLATNPFSTIKFETIKPSKRHNWLNLANNDWENLISVASKDFKLGKNDAEKAIFKLFSLGVVTNRDEWVHDFNKDLLSRKVQYFIQIYNEHVARYGGKIARSDVEDTVDHVIKWTRATKNDLTKGKPYEFKPEDIVTTLYRPYVKLKLYFNQNLNEMQYQLPSLFQGKNQVIVFNAGNRQDFAANATDVIPNLAMYSADPAQCLPLYRYDKQGNRADNITDWALAQFRAHYFPGNSKVSGKMPEEVSGKMPEISKRDIFHYVYAVLHHPAYREKYKLNLKREFPRIPFYDDFWQWAAWGERLMDLHLHYETIAPYPLERSDINPDDTRKA